MENDAVGFDPSTRRWIRAAYSGNQYLRLPAIEGCILVDEDARRAVAEDFGKIARCSPLAVLKPRTVGDITKVVRFCRDQRIPVAMRGQGHSTYGQVHARSGLVIDSQGLRSVHGVRDGQIVVDAGACWRDVLNAALVSGQTPPVLTDFLGLSVGGTLSFGGFGGASGRYGTQADNVIALDVVLADGELRTCSLRQDRELFEAALCGLGQCALIVRATLALKPAPAMVRRYKLHYQRLAAMMEDQARLVQEGRFDHVEGQVYLSESGDFGYVIDACVFLDGQGVSSGDEAESALLGDLCHNNRLTEITEMPYRAFAERMDPYVARFRETGEWYHAHPWFNVLLPASKARPYVEDALRTLRPDDIGGSRVVVLYPLRRDLLKRPMLRVPDDEIVFLFALLRAAPPASPDIERAVADNRVLYEKARASGGTVYPIGAIPFAPADWRAHFGRIWETFCTMKRLYDPCAILAPGYGIWISPGSPATIRRP